MRIYNKKGFWESASSLALAILLFIGLLTKGFDFGKFIPATFLLLIGMTGILRSLSSAKSREDILINNDERDKYISLLTSQKTLKILHMLNFILVIVFIIAYGITKLESLMVTCIVLGLFYTISLIVECVVNIYYEIRK